jgi:xylulokinase
VKQCNTLQKKYGDLIFKTTWQRVNPSWTLSQLLWLKESEPEIWSKLRKIQVTKDYIRFRFTDTYQTDAYDAVGTQLYDVNNNCWSEELLNILEFDHHSLPTVADATAISGGINQKTARDSGLIEGTPVAVGSGDSVIEAFGIGAINPGNCVIKIATAANVNLVCAEPFPSFNTITYPYLVGGYWFSITATNSGASTMRWFRDTFCREEIQKAKAGGISVYQLIGQLSAGVPPGCEGLIFHPYLMGERTPYWDPYLRGDFLGINARHRRDHFARAILEGVAFSIRDCFEVVSNLGQAVTEILIVGGGSKSSLWCQIVADILGKELNKPFVEDAAFGAAVLAGIASGMFSDWHDAIRSKGNILETITPNPDTHTLYNEYFSIYRESVQDIAEHSRKLAKIAVKSNEQKTIKIE